MFFVERQQECTGNILNVEKESVEKNVGKKILECLVSVLAWWARAGGVAGFYLVGLHTRGTEHEG